MGIRLMRHPQAWRRAQQGGADMTLRQRLQTWSRRRLTMTLGGAFAVMLAAGVLLTGTFNGGRPEAVQASAMGVEPFNEGTVDTPYGSYDVPRGELDHGITGSGLDVEGDSAGFTSVSPVCNWEIVYEHSDLDGEVYRSKSTGVISDCDTNVNAPGVTWTGEARPGKSCAILRAGGDEYARQCHNITAE